MAYIGARPLIGNYQICDALTASATADYTLQVGSVNVVPESANAMIVSLNSVIQAPGASGGFTVSGSTISFNTALTSSDVINFIYIFGDVLDIGTPTDGTVTAAKLAADAVTTAKILDSNVTTAKIADNNVTLAKLGDGTQGDILYYGASGAPARLGFGTSGDFLKTQGTGANPTWASSGGAILKGASIVVKAAETFTGTAPAVMSSYDLAFQATAADSKLWLHMSLNLSGSATSYAGYFYNSTAGEIASPIGDASGSSIRSSWRGQTNNNDYAGSWTYGCWYEPGNTTNNTYQIFGNANSSATMYLNRAGSSVDSAAIYYARTASTFTILEYAASVITLSGY